MFAKAIRDDAGFITDVVVVGEETVLIGHTCEGNGDMSYEPFPCPLEMRLWAGDPQLGDWESIDFGGFSCLDVEGECYATVDRAAGSSTEMLVTGEKTVGSETDGYTSQRAIWVSTDEMTTWNRYAFPTMETLELDEWVILRDDPVWVFGVGVQDIIYYRGEWIMVLAVEAWNWQDDTVRYEHLLLSSEDGARWERIMIDDFDTEHGDSIAALVAGPDQLVALGKTGEVQRRAAWVTVDTSVWEHSEIESNSVGELFTATYDDQLGFVASGDFLDGQQTAYDFWVSPNGTVWVPAGLPGDDGFWARSITSSDGAVVSTGITNFDKGEGDSVMGLFLWTFD